MEKYEQVMEHHTKNIFNSDMLKLKKSIEYLFDKVEYTNEFFKSVSKDVNVSEFTTDFTNRGHGVNPMQMGQGNKLKFYYK